jgi:hypothetical protein
VLKPDQFYLVAACLFGICCGKRQESAQPGRAGSRSLLRKRGSTAHVRLAMKGKAANGPFRTLFAIAVAIAMALSPHLGRIRSSFSCSMPTSGCNKNCPASCKKNCPAAEPTHQTESNCCSVVPAPPRAFASSAENDLRLAALSHLQVVSSYSARMERLCYKPVFLLLTGPPPLRLLCSLQL